MIILHNQMEDSNNLYKDLEEKDRVLGLIRAEIYDQLNSKGIDDQDMNYVTDVPITLATLLHSVRSNSMTPEACNTELDVCYVHLMDIAKSRDLKIDSSMITDFDRLGKRFFEDSETAPSKKRKPE